MTDLDVPVDYGRLAYYWQAHHLRFQRFTAQRPDLLCMECRGGGGWTEPVLDDGSGPWEPCGWCEGTGLMTPHGRGAWLNYRRAEKRRPT